MQSCSRAVVQSCSRAALQSQGTLGTLRITDYLLPVVCSLKPVVCILPLMKNQEWDICMVKQGFGDVFPEKFIKYPLAMGG